MNNPSGTSRRTVLAVAAAAATAPFVAGGEAGAAPESLASAGHHPGTPTTWDLTLLGTSDTHGNVYNWDYYKDAEYDDSAHNDIGLAKVATLVNQIRAERRGKATLSSTPATRSRARPWPRTTRSRSRSPRPARSTRWRGR